MRHIVIAALWCASSWCGVAQTPPASGAPGTPAWTTPRRHFSFSDVVFDLDYGMWARGPRFEALRDCSNRDTHCFSSATFSVALPRHCADLAAGHWSVGEVRTEVIYRHIASSPPLHGGGSATTLYLGGPEQPNLLYVYVPDLGLRGLYWDSSEHTDFVAMARAGRLESWLASNADAEVRQSLYFPITTFDRVGACN